MSHLLDVNETDFEEAVLQSKVPVLVDFWGPDCRPCVMVAPVLDKLAEEYNGRAVFVKVNVSEHPRIASQYGVMGLPTLIVFKDGKPFSNLVGYQSKSELKETLEEAF
jgi:thioredoxin 1